MASMGCKTAANLNLIGCAFAAVLALAACGEAKTSSAASTDTSGDVQLDASSGDALGADAVAADTLPADTLQADTLQADTQQADSSGTDAVAADQAGTDADATPDPGPDAADAVATLDAQEIAEADSPDTLAPDAGTPDSQQADVAEDAQPGSKEAACIASGGAVQSSMCCGATSEFPNLCAIGACGCAPQYSKDTKVCACPSGMCFDGAACVYLND